MDIYQANSEALVMMAGADVGLPQQATYNGIPVMEWPRLVLSPSFAPCLDAIKVRPVVGAAGDMEARDGGLTVIGAMRCKMQGIHTCCCRNKIAAVWLFARHHYYAARAMVIMPPGSYPGYSL
jgi:hypothetical protein